MAGNDSVRTYLIIMSQYATSNNAVSHSTASTPFDLEISYTVSPHVRGKKRHDVLNIDLLAVYLRQNYRWMGNWTWRRLIEHQKAEDDIDVEKIKKEKKARREREDEEAGERVRRRRDSFAL
jgi:hypothetical protein